jgi:hypothetical protein
MNDCVLEINEEPKVKIKLFGEIYEIHKLRHGESLVIAESKDDILKMNEVMIDLLVKRGIPKKAIDLLTVDQMLSLMECLGGKKK